MAQALAVHRPVEDGGVLKRMDFEFIVDGARRTIALEKKGDLFLVKDGNLVLEADIVRISKHEVLLRLGDRSLMVRLARDGERAFVWTEGRAYVLSEPAQDSGRSSGGDDKSQEGSSAIRAPMPGKVIKVNVSEGQEVRKNQSLLIVEAMKMENEIRSAVEGIVKKIHVAAGELVDSEKTLVELEPKR